MLSGYQEKLAAFVYALEEAEEARLRDEGITCYFDEDGKLKYEHRVFVKRGRKFDKIDIGSSGAYMVERATGELYNIKAYGVPDYNKKRKADIGNIFTADAKEVLAKRYNYLK